MLMNVCRAIVLLGIVLAASMNIWCQSLREAARLDAEGKCDEAERPFRAILA
jgi:hypothetical protein